MYFYMLLQDGSPKPCNLGPIQESSIFDEEDTMGNEEVYGYNILQNSFLKSSHFHFAS